MFTNSVYENIKRRERLIKRIEQLNNWFQSNHGKPELIKSAAIIQFELKQELAQLSSKV